MLVAASVSTADGITVRFEDLWFRRQQVEIGNGVTAAIPCIDDLISTKRLAARPRDADDIRWLEQLEEPAMKMAPTFSAEQRATIRSEEERRLTPAQFEARVQVPTSDSEREDFQQLVRWFVTRYPTAGDRLRAMRRRMESVRQRTR